MKPTGPAPLTVIGMHGFARSGKDTAGYHLTTGRGFTRFSFGDNLRDELQQIDPFVNGSVRFREQPDSEEGQRLVVRYAQLIAETGGDAAIAYESAFELNPFIDGTERQTELVERFDGDWDAIKADPTLKGEPRELQKRHGTEVRRNLFTQDYWTELVATQIEASGTLRAVITDTRFPNEALFVRNRYSGIVIEVQRASATSGSQHVSDMRLPEALIDVTIENNGTRGDLAERLDQELFDRDIAFFPPVLRSAA